MTETRELHIWNGWQGDKRMAHCGVEIDKTKPHFISVNQAIHTMQQYPVSQPCPACARAIITELLKAID